LSWVGERGPELVNLPMGAQVIPNNKLGNMGGRAGGKDMTVNIYNAPEGDHQVRQSDDGRTLEVQFERRAIAAVTGPKGQQALRNTFGIRPNVRGA
jgi:hypothetical protein